MTSHLAVLVTSGGNAPQMPLTTYGQQPSYPGYQPVPLQHSSAIPTAPTPYMEAGELCKHLIHRDQGFYFFLFLNLKLIIPSSKGQVQ